VVVAAAGGALLALPAPSTAARSAASLTPGLGMWVGDTDFVGFYVARAGGVSTKVYCIRPNDQEPTSVTLRTVGRLPGATKQTTRLLAETLAAHGDAQTPVQAAAVSQALNAEIGNHRAVQRRAATLPARVQELADRYVAEARAMAGPYRLAIHLPRSPLPGQSARGTVTLGSARGPARGTVRLDHTANVTTPDELQFGADGQARFTYATTVGGPVHIAATAAVAPSTVRATAPVAGTQVMVAASAATHVHANSTYEGSGPGIKYRYSCSSECAGIPTVTLTACAPPSSIGSRVTFWLDDRVRRISFPAARERHCRSIRTALPDGTRVSATWRYRTAHGWTRALPAAGAFVVDCPPAPPVALAVSYDCDDAAATVMLGRQQDGVLEPLHNRTTHRLVLVVQGAATGRFAVAAGETATAHTFPVACGTGATLTVRSGVQRTAGDVNYGDPLEVTMP
jgi:hypothetical protein